MFQEHTLTRSSCRNHNNVRVLRAYAHQSIHAQTIITFVFVAHTLTQSIHAQTIIKFAFQEHTLTRASMPKPFQRSCSKSIRSPEHPCPNHNNVRVRGAYAHPSIHAQTIIKFAFQEHTLTRASMPSLYASNFKPQVTLGKWYFYLFYSSRKFRFFLLSKSAFRCSETLQIAQNVDPSQCFRPSPK